MRGGEDEDDLLSVILTKRYVVGVGLWLGPCWWASAGLLRPALEVMASGNRRHGKEPSVVAEENFPDGLRVLAVDDDPVCLRVLAAVLRQCNYKPTIVTDGMTALKMLREEGEDQFDLVITDVHMPNMDGFQLLEIIGLEMDLPVIMLSANGEKATVYKGIKHGACDFIVKPVNIKEIRNIWQHVVRKNHVAVNYSSSHSDDADQRVGQPVIAEGGTKSKKCSKKKRNYRDVSDENRESRSIRTTRKKPRLSWTGELHNRFLEVVNRLGIDRAVPKAILQMMNVHNLSRESVASHLQKYRLYLKRVIDDPTKRNPLGDLFQRRKTSYMDMGHQVVPLPPSSALCSFGSQNLYVGPPSILGPQGLSVHPMNWATSIVGNAGRMPDAGSRHASGPPVGPLEKTSDHPMQDAFPRMHGPARIRSRKSYESVLRGKLLEVSTNVVPSSHPGSSSFPAEMPNDELLEPANQFPVQPPELIGHFSGPMGMAPSGDTQFQNHDGNYSNPWQNVAPSSSVFHMVGAPLIPSSQVNVNLPHINQQLTIFAPSSGEMAMFQNEQQQIQMAGTNINNTTSVGVYSERMTPLFNMASNTAPLEMTNDNFSLMKQMMVNGRSTSSPARNQASNPVAPSAQMVNGGGSISSAFSSHLNNSFEPLTQMVNGGGSSSSALSGHLDNFVGPQTQTLNGGEGASGILPEQDDTAELETPDDQPTYSTSDFLEDLFASMASEDFNPDAILFDEEY
ncbi:hypothetical protein QYE76_036610 [Lolium multiflorum]|uniref:Two-component response regulator n=1 Tax=Lolium multiflorum TaxID=4521 RepID=A0AAD8R2A4_LOLMU|nr:hypothetical protein QYE76_036610 [Lolium multiflorum]